MKKADLILTADWHMMETNPICRLDDFVGTTQWKKLKFISDLQRLHECAVICAGDVFDYWKPSPELLAKAFINIPEEFWSVYGNHDLPQHSLDLKHKCGLFTLAAGHGARIIPHGHWGKTDKTGSWNIEGRTVFVWHLYNYKGGRPWPGCTAPTAARVLRDNPQFDLIVTGDNHTPFVEKYEGRLLVNPGSIFRLTAAQMEHKPRVYLWYADTNEVEAVYLPIEEGVISREHIELEERKENRIDAYISSLDHNWEVSVSFKQNLEIFKQTNNPRESVMELVYKATEI